MIRVEDVLPPLLTAACIHQHHFKENTSQSHFSFLLPASHNVSFCSPLCMVEPGFALEILLALDILVYIKMHAVWIRISVIPHNYISTENIILTLACSKGLATDWRSDGVCRVFLACRVEVLRGQRCPQAASTGPARRLYRSGEEEHQRL